MSDECIMAVMSDKQLKELLLQKSLIVHPILSLDQIQGSRIDLRLGNILYLIKHFERQAFDPKNPEEDIDYGEEHDVAFDKLGVVLQIGDFAIAPLFEHVSIPDNMVGTLDGRSSLGRLGLIIHATAGGIEPGFSGELTCELSNLGKVPVILYPLMRIASLTVEELSSKSEVPYNSEARAKKYGNALGTLLQNDYEFSLQILDEMQKYM